MRWQNMAGQWRGCGGLVVVGERPATEGERNGAEAPK